MKYLVTGAAGFIGSAIVKKLNSLGHDVIGIDNINNYYDVNLKHTRLNNIKNSKFKFIELDIVNKVAVSDFFMA
ncbi:TPA: NAD-dependent epimerase/dehydratase family protein, partial [Providencia alcalifaciens]